VRKRTRDAENDREKREDSKGGREMRKYRRKRWRYLRRGE